MKYFVAKYTAPNFKSFSPVNLLQLADSIVIGIRENFPIPKIDGGDYQEILMTLWEILEIKTLKELL
ncbi:hypothetical protein IQ218_09305 [Synechocystis salina LEGE 06099]|uniref:hypothetical protein n=1 Tax=Synechocystis salina TaxID=945780 RepID=UPI001880450C|nr:hypothetical protein [Synechocystis salina]MBE9203608.1 hypothetical protein [Synechocystis salina LEGE 06099]